MYDISVPVFVTSDTYDKEKVLLDLRLMGAKRVFLAIPFLTHDKSVMDGYYKKVEESVEYFKANKRAP